MRRHTNFNGVALLFIPILWGSSHLLKCKLLFTSFACVQLLRCKMLFQIYHISKFGGVYWFSKFRGRAHVLFYTSVFTFITDMNRITTWCCSKQMLEWRCIYSCGKYLPSCIFKAQGLTEVVYRKNISILLVDNGTLPAYKVMSFNIRSLLIKTLDWSVETLGRKCNLCVVISFI